MKTTLTDLNEYLFEAMERITNDDLTEEEVDREVKRAETLTKVAHTVIDAAALQFQAYKLATEYSDAVKMPALLGVTNDN